MKAIPVDVAALSVSTALGRPVPLLDLDGAQRANRDGVPLMVVEVAVVPRGGVASVIKVKIAGKVDPGVAENVPVVLSGLVATSWDMNGRHGVVFSAESIRPKTGPTQPGPGTRPAA
jgi:hypothetical protein